MKFTLGCLLLPVCILFLATHTQLGYKLGRQRLYHDGQEQEQPVWNCIKCNLSNSLKIEFFQCMMVTQTMTLLTM